MNFHGLRQCASKRYSGFIRVLFPVPAVTVLLLALSAGGCISTQLKAGTSRPVESKMDIFVHSEIGPHMMDTLCIFPFSAPAEMAEASCAITLAFQARLIQRRPFREARVLNHVVKSDAEALWYARNEGCELAMVPVLIYMMDGTGAMPTTLDIRTRILDARTGKVLWDVKQHGWSEPGPDIDLTWNTIVGEPAKRVLSIADCLAVQLANFLIPPPPEK
jgi:hypothetical protein